MENGAIFDGVFRRRYSVALYKNLRFPLGEMSLYKNFTDTGGRGDPYPTTGMSGEVSESVGLGRYRASSAAGGKVARLLGGHFPYASYEIKIARLCGEAGVGFFIRREAEDLAARRQGKAPGAEIFISGCDGEYEVGWRLYENGEIKAEGRAEKKFAFSDRLLVTCRGGAFDVYLAENGALYPVAIFNIPGADIFTYEDIANETEASVYCRLPAGGEFESDGISFFLDSGISQADIRPIRYEDGTPYTENGRVFFTLSLREEEAGYQGVISLTPTGCDPKLEGGIFFNTGDGRICADVASSVVFDRVSDRWLIWYCSFSHGHVLAHDVSRSPLCRGLNIIDATLMPSYSEIGTNASESDKALGMIGTNGGSFGKATLPDDRMFFSKYGDEDPDFVYDKSRGVWMLTVCRADSGAGGKYRYFRFESKDPFEGYVFCEKTLLGENTGGSIVKRDDGYVFVCGSDFGRRAVYYAFRIGEFDKPERLNFDRDDGGFRGWGTVLYLPRGSRTVCYHFTFDRHNGSRYNWSYGNLYLFELFTGTAF